MRTSTLRRIVTPLLVIAFFATPTLSASAQWQDEHIQSFSAEVVVHPDATFSVVEMIAYDFGENERHGIFRIIPLKNESGRIRLSDITVTDETGTPVPFVREGDRSEEYLRIGDPDVTVHGVHRYRISYTVQGGVRYFADFDEVYWNVTGNGWDVPIDAASAVVRVPPSIPQEKIEAACYRGFAGVTDACVEKSIAQTGVDTAISFKDSFLGANEGLTVAVGFPKGVVAEPTKAERLLSGLFSLWFVPIPFLVALFWFRRNVAYAVHRFRFYRHNTIIPEYDPGDADPLEAAGILRGMIGGKELSAEIISLAVRGYLTIQNVDDEYVFTPTDKDRADISLYDLKLLEGISHKSESDLLYAFAPLAGEITQLAAQSLHIRNYTEAAPRSIGKNPVIIFLAFFFSVNPGIFIWIFVGYELGFIFSVSCLLIGILSLSVGPRPARLTQKGLEAERKLLGLRQYIEVGEKDRIAFHSAPEKRPELFETLLPYAMVFGFEKEWAKQFADIYTHSPSWYSSSSHDTFSAVAFGSAMHDFSSSVGKTVSTLPSSSGGSSGSSGGGSSGGGGGGGGGGSW